MGMYTELYISCQIRLDIPANVLGVLEFLFGGKDTLPNELPSHELFDCSRWTMIGRSGSYYFTPTPSSKFIIDNINNSYYVTSRSDFKNYSDEIGKFFDWIMPYVDEPVGTHIGHRRYEECSEPTLIYKIESK